MKENINTKISKQDKITTIFEIIEENGVSNYEISKNTGISEAGLGSITNREVKNPRELTVNAIYDYLTSKYKSEEVIGNVVLENNSGSISNNTMIGNIGGINGRNSIGTPIVETKEVVDYNNGVPYYNIDFINGFTSVEEVAHHNAEYNINYPPANHCEFWVNATGDSMRGIIDNGDKIALKLVDKEWFPLGEVYAIITTNGHRMVKKIAKSEDKECYKLVSANPDKEEFPDQDIPKRMIHTLFKVVTAIKLIN